MILYGSKESEPEEITMTCWVADGRYYGDRDTAMLVKSTHMKCPICSEPAKIGYVHCKKCAETVAWEKYWAKEAILYTGCPVALFDPTADDLRIFWDEDDLQDYLEMTNIRAEDITLISVEEESVPRFDPLDLLDDYVADEDGLTDEFIHAVTALNEAIKSLPRNYYKGQDRIQLPKGFGHEEAS